MKKLTGEPKKTHGDLSESEVETFVDGPPEEVTPKVDTPQSIAVDALFRSDAALRRALTENLKSLHGESEAVAARVEKVWKFRPSELSAEELARRHYVDPGSDPGEVLHTVIMSGVEALRSSDTAHCITLRDSAELRKLIKTNQDEGGSLKGVVELDSLIEFIEQRGAGPLQGAELTSTPYRAEAKAEAILDAVENDDRDKDGKPVARRQALTSAAAKAEELVKNTVNKQMESATAPETQLTYAKLPSSADEDETQQMLMQTFAVREGPTDVTSYHDFHTLQIAFEHVWTEIFDGQLEALGRDLYGEYVKLKDFIGSTQPDLRVGTLADLKRLIEEIKKLSQTVQDNIPRSVRPEGDDQRSNGWVPPIGPENVLTGGLSLLIKAAVNEIINSGKKPVLNWYHLDGGQLPGNKGRITAMFSSGAPTGRVEIALQTDHSDRKILEFQPYDPNAGKFVNHIPNYSVSNKGHPEPYITPYVNLSASDMASGVIEFASQDTETTDSGRYVLAGLEQKLVSGTRVVFHWRD